MTCELCSGKQLIPFVKDGRVIPFAWVNCICKVEEPERFQEIRPEDFDYPMSETFRESTFELYGRPWEHRNEIYQPEEQPTEVIPQKIIVKHHYTQGQEKNVHKWD